MEKLRLYITMPEGELRNSFLGNETIAYLSEHFSVTLNGEGRNLTEEELGVAARGFDALLTGWGTANLKKAGLLERGSAMRLLIHTGGSVGDLIDGTAYDNGVTVISGNKIYAESTAEGALAYILTGLRYIPDDVSRMKSSSYWDSPYKTAGLFDRSIGLVGVGAVSRALMSFLAPFRARLKVYDTYEVDSEFLRSVNAEQVSLDELLSTCSVVSLHMALGEKTRGMIGSRELSLMEDGTLLVNTSRGAIIDESALISELSTGRIRAVLDVFEHEPLGPDSPLRQMDNVYLIPHKAGPTFDLRRLIGRRLACDAVSFTKGEELYYAIERDVAARMTKHG